MDNRCGAGLMEVDGELHEVDVGSGLLTHPFFFASIHIISLEGLQGPRPPLPLPPSELDAPAGQVLPSDEALADNRCSAGVMGEISMGGDQEDDGGSGKLTCLFLQVFCLILLEDLQDPSRSSLPPSILDKPTTPTAVLPKQGKVYPSLVSALNAVHNAGSAEESSLEGEGDDDDDDDDDDDVSGSHCEEGDGPPLKGLGIYGESDDDEMAVDSGFPVLEKSSPWLLSPSPSSSSSSEDSSTPSKSRALT